MHYYDFNIADYRKDTGHLTPIEHYIYRTLIDWYYLDEKPIPEETQWVTRRLCLGTDSEPTVNRVLTDFFKLGSDGWHHSRIDAEIAEYHGMCIKNKLNGKQGGRPKKTQSVATGNPVVTLTSNQEPITNNQERERTQRATRLPADWVMPADWGNWALSEKPDWSNEEVLRVAADFKDYWVAKAGRDATKLDWLATWRKWVRNTNSRRVA